MSKSVLTALIALALAALLASPVLAQGRDNDRPGNSGGGNSGGSSGNSGNSGNDNRGNSGNSGNSNTQTASATPTRTGGTTTASASTTPTAAAGSPATPTTDDKDKGKDDKDNHGGAVRDAVQEARESSSGPGRGREISDAARSALGKPEQAVVSVEGLLASLSGMQALIVGTGGETSVTLTEETRIKTQDDSDATLDDLAALAGSAAVRARGRMGADGSLVAMRLEVRGEADGVTVALEGVIDALSATGFTLVTRTAGAPTGTTATTTAPAGTTVTTTTTTTTTAPTGTTATSTTTVPTGTTATSTVPVGGTYTVIVTADTTIRRNETTTTLAALQAGDEVEARGTLDGATLTATRVLADGPAPVGTVTTTTSGAPTGSTVTTTAPTGSTATR